MASDHKLKRSGYPDEAIVAAGIPLSSVGETFHYEVVPNITTQNVSAASGWYNSPPHRAIMLDPDFDLVGIGIAYTDRPLRVYRNGQPHDFTAVVVAIYRRNPNP